MSDKGFRIEIPMYVKRDRRARKVISEGEAPIVEEQVPRIARLLALAHKWEGMVQRGDVKNYSEIAQQIRLTKVRVSQILGLTLLSPDIQERILLTPTAKRGSSAPKHRLRDLAGQPLWTAQRETLALRKTAQRTHLPPRYSRNQPTGAQPLA